MKIFLKPLTQFIFFVVLVLALGLGTAQAQNYARFRMVHAIPQSQPADIYVDGQIIFSGLSYRTVSDYRQLLPGDHQIRILPAGANSGDPAVIETSLNFSANQDYTLVAMGMQAQEMALLLFNDRNEAPLEGQSRVRTIHASPNAPNIDVCIANQPNCPVMDMAFRSATNYVPLNAGTYSFNLRRTGTEEIVLVVPNVRFETGINYTLFLMGVYQGEPALQIITSADSIRPPVQPPTTGAFLSPPALMIVLAILALLVAGSWFSWRRLVNN
jgi:hypothetical protein